MDLEFRRLLAEFEAVMKRAPHGSPFFCNGTVTGESSESSDVSVYEELGGVSCLFCSAVCGCVVLVRLNNALSSDACDCVRVCVSLFIFHSTTSENVPSPL